MATPASAPAPKTSFADVVAGVKKTAEPYAVPYYLTLGAVIGGITVLFLALTVVIVLVATNFNVLSLIE